MSEQSEVPALVENRPEQIDPAPSPFEQWQVVIGELKAADPARRFAAARIIRHGGSAVVPLLIEALEGTTPEHQEAILATLGLMGRQARAAIAAIEKLTADEHLGPAARDALKRIRWRFRLDRDQFLDVAIPCAIVVLVGLTMYVEIGQWAQLWARLTEAGRAVGVAWGFLGAIAGFFAGSSLGSPWLARKGAKFLAVAGLCLGAVCGRGVALLLEPLLQALGS